MGALTYYPEQSFSEENDNTDLDELAFQCQKILHTEYSDKLDELYRAWVERVVVPDLKL